MPIYMQFPGANGSVTARNFQGWIELMSVSFGMDRPTDSRLGTTGYAATGKLQIHNITISKPTDRSSPTLTIAALQGAFNKTVKIAFTTTSASGMVNFLSYELHQCGFSSAHTNGSSDGLPVETYTLSFSQIQFTFNNMDEAGQSQPTITCYDLSPGQSL